MKTNLFLLQKKSKSSVCPILFIAFVFYLTINSFASNTNDFFRSSKSGNWTDIANWESSNDNINWVPSTLIPSNIAAQIIIQSDHTIKINDNISVSSILIDGSGCLTFDGIAARNLEVIGDIIVNESVGSFITQLSGNFTNTMTTYGNIVNNGVFDLSRGTNNLVCDIIFKKNGNQSVSGNGLITRFNEITLDMGNTRNNILEILSSNFYAPNGFIETISGVANRLKNGTLKISGTFAYTGSPFIPNTYNNMIVATAGLWLNNPNLTLTAFNDSFDIEGLLKISDGTMNIGTTVGNSIRYMSGSSIIIEGGNLNVISRLQPKIAAVSTTNFNQSGGNITLMTSNLNGGSVASLDFSASGSLFSMSGGTIVLQNENGTINKDVNIKCTTTISGGIIQIGNNASANIPDGFLLFSESNLPSISIYSVSINNNYPIVKLSKNTSVIGSVSIGNNCTLDVSDDGGLTSYELAITGNFINNGNFISRLNTIIFSGSIGQDISGNSITSFNNFSINNSSLNGLTLNNSIIISGLLNLVAGKIYSNNNFTLTLTTTATSTLGSEISFVEGPLTKIGTNDFIFPIGKGTKWRRIKISNISESDTFTAEYFNSGHSNASFKFYNSNEFNWISSNEYWNINRVGSANAGIELFWENASESNLINCSSLKIARWNFNESKWETSNTNQESTTGSCSGNNSGSIFTGSNINNFGDFTFGSYSVIALPIELINFEATIKEKYILLSWTTLSEYNNDFFIVEKTKDGQHFERIEKINAAGNHTGKLNYQVIDTNPIEGFSYYQLSEVDIDGKKKTYPMQSILYKQKHEFPFAIYPNPIKSNQELEIKHDIMANKLLEITIQDSFDKIIKTMTFSTQTNNETIELTIPNNLEEGLYFLKIKTDDNIYTKKFLIRD